MSQQRTIRVVAAVLEKEGRYLITQRRATAVLPLMWEFPGGRVEDGETDAHALKREVRHRLGVIGTSYAAVLGFALVYLGEHYVVDLFLYECTLLGETLEGRNVNAFQWVTSAEFDQFPFTPADEASMNKLLGVT